MSIRHPSTYTRYAFTLSYNGTFHHGFPDPPITPQHPLTLSQRLHRALNDLVNGAAGTPTTSTHSNYSNFHVPCPTDPGVHALHNVLVVDIRRRGRYGCVEPWEPKRLVLGLNHCVVNAARQDARMQRGMCMSMEHEVKIGSCWKMERECIVRGRTYVYRIVNVCEGDKSNSQGEYYGRAEGGFVPFTQLCEWHVPTSQPLMMDDMQELAKVLQGKVEEVRELTIQCEPWKFPWMTDQKRCVYGKRPPWSPQIITVRLTGTGHCATMRKIMGWLVQVGKGELCVGEFRAKEWWKTLSSDDILAPAKGLMLVHVELPESCLPK